VRGNVGVYLEAILLNVKEGLQVSKGGKRSASEGSILECIRMLAAAVVWAFDNVSGTCVDEIHA
jgi:hypothetical protein